MRVSDMWHEGAENAIPKEAKQTAFYSRQDKRLSREAHNLRGLGSTPKFATITHKVMNMSLDKAIKYGKEKRKPYRKAQAIDKTCRNHCGCPHCAGNRKYKFRDKHPYSRDDLE